MPFYYVEYDTWSLPSEIEANSIVEAEIIANDYINDLGIEITIEIMEE